MRIGCKLPAACKNADGGIHFSALLMRETVGFQANYSNSIENAALHSQNTFESESLDIKIQALDEYRRLWYNIAIVWACRRKIGCVHAAVNGFQ